MSSFTDLLALPEERLVGSWHTAHEIAQQPRVWMKVLDLLETRTREIAAFLRDDTGLILSGAGSSDYVGRSVASSLRRRLGREVVVVPTTTAVTHPDACLRAGQRYTMVHFARSGDSPESLAAYRLIRRTRPDVRHLVVTCNGSGALRKAAEADGTALVLVLPPETNDRSLAMTSSFTSMALCALGLGWLGSLEDLRSMMGAVCAAADRAVGELGNLLMSLGEHDFTRAFYLGSDGLQGAMDEGALKMLEMTAGRIITSSNSYLGARHGPQVFIDSHCLVVACLASEPRVRRYELDFLGELRRKEMGTEVLAVTATTDPETQGLADTVVELAPSGGRLADELRVLTDVVVCQLLAFSKSRACGLKPDAPSPRGIISRVVQGVTIYDA